MGAFDYRIEIDSDNKVVVVGKNGGSIRGRQGQGVTFTAGNGVTGFRISATEWLRNASSAAPKNADAFEPPPIGKAVSKFSSNLAALQGGQEQLIAKYTVTVDGSTPADPIIIIDK